MSLKTFAFVDAAHVRETSFPPELNVRFSDVSLYKLSLIAASFLAAQGHGEHLQIHRVHVYDAVPDKANESDNAVEAWLTLNNREPDTHVRRGALKLDRRGGRTQKGVDVLLAVDAMQAVSRSACEAVILLAGDADFVPLVEGLKSYGVLAAVAAFPSALSEDLRDVADRVYELPLTEFMWNTNASDPFLPEIAELRKEGRIPGAP